MHSANQLHTASIKIRHLVGFQKLVTIGKYRSSDGYRDATANAGVTIDESAKEVLDNIPFAESEAEVRISLMQVGHMGFSESGSYEEIFAKGKESGRRLCIPEIGPASCLMHDVIPIGVEVIIAMDPVKISNRIEHNILTVGRDKRRAWLSVRCWNPQAVAFSVEWLMFML